MRKTTVREFARKHRKRRFDIVWYMKHPNRQTDFFFAVEDEIYAPHPNYYHVNVNDEYTIYFIGQKVLIVAKTWELRKIAERENRGLKYRYCRN